MLARGAREKWFIFPILRVLLESKGRCLDHSVLFLTKMCGRALQDLLNSMAEVRHSEGFGQPWHAALCKESQGLGAQGIPGEKNEPLAQLRRVVLQCPVEA